MQLFDITANFTALSVCFGYIWLSTSANTAMPQNRKPSPTQESPLAQPGFEEAQAAFLETSPAQQRFNESVALLRAFNLIDCPEARQKVIDLARSLAKAEDGE